MVQSLVLIKSNFVFEIFRIKSGSGELFFEDGILTQFDRHVDRRVGLVLHFQDIFEVESGWVGKSQVGGEEVRLFALEGVLVSKA